MLRNRPIHLKHFFWEVSLFSTETTLKGHIGVENKITIVYHTLSLYILHLYPGRKLLSLL